MQNPLLKWRRSQGLSTRELGREIGVTSMTVSSWERGASYPRPGHVAALAKLMGIRAATLAARWIEWWEQTQPVGT